MNDNLPKSQQSSTSSIDPVNLLKRINDKLKMKIIQAYVPTSTKQADRSRMDQFYESINGALMVSGSGLTFLIDYFNVKLSEQLEEAETVISAFGIEVRNGRCSALNKFLSQHRLYLQNFLREKNVRWTWVSQDLHSTN